jgi:dihydroorotate dehydrogenase (fumarate)
MPNIETSYMNLKLKNPLIVASSGLTKSVDKIKACEQAAAGAVVVKSLFEEALAQTDWGLESSTDYHPEAYDYLRAELPLQYGGQEYCALIKEAKKQVAIPVIASINCVSARWWAGFAKEIEDAGADALELNIFPNPADPTVDGRAIEQLHYDTLEAVKDKVSIPVAMKISSYFSSLPNVAKELANKGANALVLFNRFTEPDIQIDKIKLTTTFHFADKTDLYLPLRWIALLSDKSGCDFAATTGIQDAAGTIKMLLAGAKAVQIASTLYKGGLGKISEMLQGIESWMAEHDFDCLDQFIGRLSFAKAAVPDHYLRAQFMEKIRGIE